MVVRTRNAPSPTGFAHLGTIYQCLFNKAYADKHKGIFVLRIEDTDRSRYVEESIEALFDALEWFGLNPDESPKHGGHYGPYVQSKRLHLYQKYAEELVKKGYAYYCFCSAKRLEEVRKKRRESRLPPMYDKHCRTIAADEVRQKLESGKRYVIRMKIPEDERIVVNDLIRGPIEFDSMAIDDQVILKSDGYPTYHLAVVVDDHLMKISHVVRGPEWITSFPKHKLLYDYFGWDLPVFVHTPMITNMDGSKLSKRHGHSSVDWYRRKGFLSKAVLNFIALLGWSHPDEKEIFDYDEFVEVFDLKDLSAVSPKFDLKKLEWMNGQYLKKLSNEDFVNRLIDWLKYCIKTNYKGSSIYESHWSENDYKDFQTFIENLSKKKQILFAEINKERIKKFEDLLPLNNFFIKDIPLNKGFLTAYRKGSELKEHLEWVISVLLENTSSASEDNDWTLEDLKKVEMQVKNRAFDIGWKVLEVFYPIRISVCRSKVSPPLFESIYILGKEKTVHRLNEGINSV